jgi:hypothetical protein
MLDPGPFPLAFDFFWCFPDPRFLLLVDNLVLWYFALIDTPLDHTLVSLGDPTFHHTFLDLFFVADRDLINLLAFGALNELAGPKLVADSGFASVALEDVVGGEALDLVLAVEADEDGARPWDCLLRCAVVASYSPKVKKNKYMSGTVNFLRGAWGCGCGCTGTCD